MTTEQRLVIEHNARVLTAYVDTIVEPHNLQAWTRLVQLKGLQRISPG